MYTLSRFVDRTVYVHSFALMALFQIKRRANVYMYIQKRLYVHVHGNNKREKTVLPKKILSSQKIISERLFSGECAKIALRPALIVCT